jgi:cell division protein FtsI (penicillin-binding protein 3)
MDLRRPLTRSLILAALLALWSLAALGRLAYLELFRYADFLARAEHQQQRIVEISPKRAEVVDRNLHTLAMSALVDSCFAIPSEIADTQMVSRLLARVLNLSPAEIEARLASSHSFVWIARKLPPDTAARVAALNLKGVYFQKEDERFYPKRQLAAALLGYVDIDDKGLGGIEYSLDDRIRSKPGRMLIFTDARRRWYDSSDEKPAAGSSVVLSIDENIQFIAERELAAAIEKTRAPAGSVVVQNPSNGQILAMANWPTFNPNAVADSPAEARMNRAVSALYEPGSVFKVVTLSAAIDQGLTTPDEVVDCEMGAIYIGNHRIRDHHAFGNLTVAEILAHSSDVGAIKIGMRVGAPKLYDYIRAYGFGSPSGIELPGESRGLLRRLENWSPISIGAISMGQEVGVTPVQLITAMSVIANGGLLYRPQVVLGLQPQTGPAAPQPDPRRVISETTAATMRQMLQGVVLGGTGQLARLDGHSSAGKTGTAQKLDPGTGRYSQTQLIASFVGFAPVNNPAITILVQLDSPVGAHEGGSVAAPVFKRVAEQVLSYLNVPQDAPLPAKQLRAKRNAPAAVRSADLADFSPAATDSREAPTAPTAENSVVAPPTVALVEGDAIAVPELTGKTVREVTEICQRLGMNPVLVGTGVVMEQEPQAGTAVPRGGSVTVRFGRTPPPSAVESRARRVSRRRVGTVGIGGGQ